MSQLFLDPERVRGLPFEERLKLAFRGDVEEQKRARREVGRNVFRSVTSPQAAARLGSSQAAARLGGAGNVFKRNLGGT